MPVPRQESQRIVRLAYCQASMLTEEESLQVQSHDECRDDAKCPGR